MIVRRFLLWARTASACERAESGAMLARAYIAGEMTEEDRHEAETALLVLAEDPAPRVRRALAEVVAPAANVPRPVLLTLAGDQSDIAALVLAHSPILHEADLIDAAAIGDDLAQKAIALRRGLPVGVAAALAEVGCVDALISLAGNRSAELAAFSLERMFERAGDSAELREALLARPDLPAALRQAIAARVSDVLAAFVSGCGWLTPERSARLARESTERVAVALAAGGEECDAPAIVDALRLAGRLTPGLMLRSLLSRQPALAEAAFVVLSGLPDARVAALMRDRRGVGLPALCRKAGLPPMLQPAFCAAIVALNRRGFDAPGTGGVDRAVLSEVIQNCGVSDDPSALALLALLRRLDAEAAREEARVAADALADDAALALVIEMDPLLLVELDPEDVRQAA